MRAPLLHQAKPMLVPGARWGPQFSVLSAEEVQELRELWSR